MAAAAAAAEVSNKRVILKRHVTGFPTEEDMELVPATARLAVPPGSAAVVVKNLYLSCDPYLRTRMSRHEEPSYVPDFVPWEVIQEIPKEPRPYSLRPTKQYRRTNRRSPGCCHQEHPFAVHVIDKISIFLSLSMYRQEKRNKIRTSSAACCEQMPTPTGLNPGFVFLLAGL